LRLAKAGHALALGDLHPADQTVTAIKAMKGAGEVGGEAFAVECDLGSPGGVALLVRKVTGRLGRCDVLVNCAGAVPAHLPSPFSASDEAAMISGQTLRIDGGLVTS
jgi:NAD(P)-dependent dehydrogenase (short-subunit alcohol dehydrogenase family)